jgi:DNA mismatch endonuclease (patch repair protein)
MKKGSETSFKGLVSSSRRASVAAKGASIKGNTRCEVVLRQELWRRGLRYRVHYVDLPGCPDIVFPRQHVAIFCDGDFWHGRDLEKRLEKLARGHNAPYWIAKIQRNVARDQLSTERLKVLSWTVLRLWETEILSDPVAAADRVVDVVRSSE